MSGFRNLSGGERFWSLRDVSFAVQRGHALGVIGRNGAGKSSLLRILAGISRPDEGTITVRWPRRRFARAQRGLPRRP
jgi:ABC-type polysaccharide/polyol phosphate transport system ATPase subunit